MRTSQKIAKSGRSERSDGPMTLMPGNSQERRLLVTATARSTHIQKKALIRRSKRVRRYRHDPGPKRGGHGSFSGHQ